MLRGLKESRDACFLLNDWLGEKFVCDELCLSKIPVLHFELMHVVLEE